MTTIQKRVTRTILGLRNIYNHRNDGFLQLKLLKCNDLNNYCGCLYVYKCINTLVNDMFNTRAYEKYNTRNNNLLTEPFMRSQHSQRSILHNRPLLWNNIPYIQKMHNITLVLKHTKTLFIVPICSLTCQMYSYWVICSIYFQISLGVNFSLILVL